MPPDPPATERTASAPSAMFAPLWAAGLVHRAWIEMGAEAIRFACDRLQQDLSMQRAILSCRDTEEIRRAQTAFLKDAQAQYAVQTGRILAMMGQTAAQAWSVPAPVRRYDDIPL